MLPTLSGDVAAVLIPSTQGRSPACGCSPGTGALAGKLALWMIHHGLAHVRELGM